MVTLLKRHEIQVLLNAGHSQAEVACLAKVSERSVRRIAAEAAVEHVDDYRERVQRRIGRPSKVDRFRPLVEQRRQQKLERPRPLRTPPERLAGSGERAELHLLLHRRVPRRVVAAESGRRRAPRRRLREPAQSPMSGSAAAQTQSGQHPPPLARAAAACRDPRLVMPGVSGRAGHRGDRSPPTHARAACGQTGAVPVPEDDRGVRAHPPDRRGIQPADGNVTAFAVADG